METVLVFALGALAGFVLAISWVVFAVIANR
jgi:hypothetical protein